MFGNKNDNSACEEVRWQISVSQTLEARPSVKGGAVETDKKEKEVWKLMSQSIGCPFTRLPDKVEMSTRHREEALI